MPSYLGKSGRGLNKKVFPPDLENGCFKLLQPWEGMAQFGRDGHTQPRGAMGMGLIIAGEKFLRVVWMRDIIQLKKG